MRFGMRRKPSSAAVTGGSTRYWRGSTNQPAKAARKLRDSPIQSQTNGKDRRVIVIAIVVSPDLPSCPPLPWIAEASPGEACRQAFLLSGYGSSGEREGLVQGNIRRSILLESRRGQSENPQRSFGFPARWRSLDQRIHRRRNPAWTYLRH